MALSLIGETLDIHSGGVDRVFPHHENEIAQSEAATGKKFVNYWVHNEHLLVDGKKMSKSLHNFYTLKDVGEKGIDPLALRYLFLTAHYRDKLNFTWEALSAAQNAVQRLQSQISNIPPQARLATGGKSQSDISNVKSEMRQDFEKMLIDRVNNDLNTPQALAVMWDMLKSNIIDSEKYSLMLEFDKVLGLELDKTPKQEPIPQEVMNLQKERDELRKTGDFNQADKLRKEIENMGYTVKDTEGGTVITKK